MVDNLEYESLRKKHTVFLKALARDPTAPACTRQAARGILLERTGDMKYFDNRKPVNRTKQKKTKGHSFGRIRLG